MKLHFLAKCKLVALYLIVRHFRPFSTRERLLRFQRRRLRRVLSRVLRFSAFYRDHRPALPPTSEGLHLWPRLDRGAYRENFARLNTLGLSSEVAMEAAHGSETVTGERAVRKTSLPEGFTAGLSSGTSGQRGLFLVSPQEQLNYAAHFLARVLPRSLFGEHRIAYFLRADSDLYTTSQSSRLRFSYHNLTTPLETHFERLHAFRPTFLFAPPSVLRKLAEAKLVGRLQVAPERVACGAEVLDPVDESFIEQAFGMKVFQIYQATEGFIGVSCTHGRIHLNEDLIHFEREYLDSGRRHFVPILTDLYRTTQPYVRYRLNDVLLSADDQGACPCGSSHQSVLAICGRESDAFQFPESGSTVYPDEVREALIRGLESDPKLSSDADIGGTASTSTSTSTSVTLYPEYQLIQRDAGRVGLQLRFPGQQEERETLRRIEVARESVRVYLLSRGGPPALEVRVEPYSDPEPRQKLRRVRREWSVG